MTEAATTETPVSKGRKPTHRLWLVQDQPEGKPASWTEISALWETSTVLSARVESWITVPPGSRLVILKAKVKADQ